MKEQEDSKLREERDARSVAGRVLQLVSEKPIDDRYWVLEQLSCDVRSCYGDWLEGSIFTEGADDLSVFRPMLDHPAAGPLLAYVVYALQNFEFVGPKEKPSTSERRAALSDAFCLTGKQGERWIPFPQRMDMQDHFIAGMHRALENAGQGSDAEKKKAAELAVKRCLRATFQFHYNMEYETFNDSHKARMRALRKILREVPEWGHLV